MSASGLAALPPGGSVNSLAGRRPPRAAAEAAPKACAGGHLECRGAVEHQLRGWGTGQHVHAHQASPPVGRQWLLPMPLAATAAAARAAARCLPRPRARCLSSQLGGRGRHIGRQPPPRVQGLVLLGGQQVRQAVVQVQAGRVEQHAPGAKHLREGGRQGNGAAVVVVGWGG